MKKVQIVGAAIELLGLTKPVRFKFTKGVIRRKLSTGETAIGLGYYDLVYCEKKGQYHRITVSHKAGKQKLAIVLHELIHAWQAENLQWVYGHGADFKGMAFIVALELDIPYIDIMAGT